VRTVDFNGLACFENGRGDKIVVGVGGVSVHWCRSNRIRSMKYEYISEVVVNPATFHKQALLRIISQRLSSTLVVPFDNDAEAEEVAAELRRDLESWKLE
jgi:hypothetical protein